jgi:hypothetical protein
MLTQQILDRAADRVREASASRLSQTVNYNTSLGILNANLSAAHKKNKAHQSRAASDTAILSTKKPSSVITHRLSIIMRLAVYLKGEDKPPREVSICYSAIALIISNSAVTFHSSGKFMTYMIALI